MAKTAKKQRESLRNMSKDELKSKLSALEESIRVLRFKAEGSKSKNVKEAHGIKKQIAQILTQMRVQAK